MIQEAKKRLISIYNKYVVNDKKTGDFNIDEQKKMIKQRYSRIKAVNTLKVTSRLQKINSEKIVLRTSWRINAYRKKKLT